MRDEREAEPVIALRSKKRRAQADRHQALAQSQRCSWFGSPSVPVEP